MMFCFCFLAYGEEHIKEFNIVAKSILKLNTDYKIIVGTDSPIDIIDGVYQTILINEPFNYNLKRIVIEHSLIEFNTVLFLDTDIFIRYGIDFSVLDNLVDGMYAAEIVGLDKLRDVYGSLDYMKEYLDELSKIYANQLFLIHEGLFILNLSDTKQKEDFIKYWEEIDVQTRPYHKLAYDLPGAMEGLIMWIAVQKSNIKLTLMEGEIEKLFNLISHFGSRGRKLIKTIL
jgi:hypothetical protein